MLKGVGIGFLGAAGVLVGIASLSYVACGIIARDGRGGSGMMGPALIVMGLLYLGIPLALVLAFIGLILLCL